ncbi:hypothetical protein NDU88_004567 [Pleurodeles waltl]|uniref:Uncharacterized protein n=1 Tax=Pleurodeles waltl TaxID=8319 RepID=A0AAV7RJJ9_PLEWA|nr:hypothetical protein NDU88_004567 [Pleurodeles waltl]
MPPQLQPLRERQDGESPSRDGTHAHTARPWEGNQIEVPPQAGTKTLERPAIWALQRPMPSSPRLRATEERPSSGSSVEEEPGPQGNRGSLQPGQGGGLVPARRHALGPPTLSPMTLDA